MPWELPEFEGNKLEKGRKLLQESEDHQGCRDLRLRVLSFNVNGIRALLRDRQKMTLSQWLNSLNADIVCLQETKLRKADVDRELAVVEGWDSFFSCAQSARGYSGTVTYVRTAVALPFAAEEGFTGCATLAGGSRKDAAAQMAEPHPALTEYYTVEELAELDSEGRVTVTDHGAFVLFNIYGPAITSEAAAQDRMPYKIRFFKALELRWRDLLRQGRAVVAVGDLNICPSPIDWSDEADSQFFSPDRPDRLWLRNLLHSTNSSLHTSYGGSGQLHIAATSAMAASAAAGSGSMAAGGSSAGILTDTFRVFHPGRQKAFTCWSTATNARVNNYGTRLDLVLTAGMRVGCPPPPSQPAAALVAAAATGAERANGLPLASAAAQGANSVPTALDWHQQEAVRGQQGGTMQAVANAGVWCVGGDIWPEQDGSDHCPVWADFACLGGTFPCARTAPPGAMRNVFKGSQLKIHSWLQPVERNAQPQPSNGAAGSCGNGPQLVQPEQQQQQQLMAATRPAIIHSSKGSQRKSSPSGLASPSGKASDGAGRGSGSGAAAGKKQASLKNMFMRQQGAQPAQAQASHQDAGQRQQQQQQRSLPLSAHQPVPQHQPQQQQQLAAGPAGSSELVAAELAAAAANHKQSTEAAKDAWRSVLQPYKEPKCFHGMPAVRKQCHKNNENKDRWFYSCALPAGNFPEGDCHFFRWVEPRASDHPSTKAKKGSGGGGIAKKARSS